MSLKTSRRLISLFVLGMGILSLALWSALSHVAAQTDQEAKLTGALQADEQQGALSLNSPVSLLFIENVGQFHVKAHYLLNQGERMTWLTKDALWISALDGETLSDVQLRRERRRGGETAISGVRLRLSFIGANPNLLIEPFNPLASRVSYLLGADPDNWRTNVPAWGGIRYHDLYPGIDLVMSAQGTDLAGSAILPWYLEVQPEADLSAVRLQIEGPEAITVDRSAMRLSTGIGPLLLPLLPVVGPLPDRATADELMAPGPEVEQTADQRFVVTAPLWHFFASDTVPDLAPAALSDLAYSTFLGGSGFWDYGEDVAVDAAGAAYLVGHTQSADFPTTPGVYTTTLAMRDAFLAKIDPAGGGAADLTYATFIGGNSFDSGYGVAVVDGEAYLSGVTSSSTFPTTPGAYDSDCGTDGQCNGWEDAFLTVLSADGSTLLYSTYLGGEDQDAALDIDLSSGEVFLAGETRSSDFPTTANAFDVECGSDGRCDPVAGVPALDGFFAKLSPAGSGQNDLLYGTFLGGEVDDTADGITIAGGDALVVGSTESPDFPVSPGNPGYAGNGDGFAMRISPIGTGEGDRVYGLFLGGVQGDTANAADAMGSIVVVVGATRSEFTFPVTPGTGPYNGGFNDAYVAWLDGAGQITYAAFLGGSEPETARAVTLDDRGGAIVTGNTMSSDFPTHDAYDDTHNGNRDAFLVRIDLNSTQRSDYITYASFLGGVGDDDAHGLDLNSEGYAYLTGYTTSADFPTTTGAFSALLGGTRDAFFSKLLASPPPGIDIEKLINGLDADEPPGVYLPVDTSISWQYIVSNTGGFDLSDVTVVDDQLGTICTRAELLRGDSFTCSHEGIAEPGQYVNVATATGQPPGALDPAIDIDLSHYFGVVAEINLEKRTAGVDADTAPGPMLRAGDVVTWTYHVTNTGNVLLSGIGVTDDLEGAASCPYSSLAPNQAMTCTLTGTVTVGQYANSADVLGTPPGGLPAASDSDPSHYFGAGPSQVIEKRTNGQDADVMPGPTILSSQTVTWTYVITNTGNVPLSTITVLDDGGVSVTCPVSELAVDASTTCTATGVAVIGQYTNTATVTATPPVGEDVWAQDLSHYFGAHPQVAIEKQTHGQDADLPPGPFVEKDGAVVWEYLVTNTGNVSLQDIVVSDDQGVAVDCPATTLAPDDSMACSAAGVALAGQYTNTGTVTATPPIGPDLAASDPSHYFGSDPGLAIRKRTNGQAANVPPGAYLQVGEPVTWTYEVTNTGNVTLTGVTVTDDQPDVTVDCPGTTLAADASMTCTATGVAVEGQYANTGTVTGLPPVGAGVSTSDLSYYYGANPVIVLAKRTNGRDADEPPGPTIQAGDGVTWTYVVSNTGNVALSNIVVGDDQELSISCPATELAVDATMTCTATGVAQVGPYTNTGTVTGDPPGDLAPVSDSDLSHYFGAQPAIDVEKRTNGQDADSPTGPAIPVGWPVAWEYRVRNEGNVPLSSVVVTDTDPGLAVDCPQTTLAADQSMTCTAAGTATTGQYENTGTATGLPPDGLAQVADSDPSHYLGINPALDLEKRTQGQDAAQAPGPYVPVGETVTWTYHVTNTGDILLLGITVVDDPLGEISCPQENLPEGAAMTCTRTGPAVAGEQVNQATAMATPLGTSMTVSDTDQSHYFGASLVLDIEKLTNEHNADAEPGPLVLAGSPITWTYLILNSSNVTLTEIALQDDVVGSIPCPTDSLAADASMICTETGIAESGQYANEGTVTGTPPGGLPDLFDSDPSHYYGVVTGVALQKRTNGQDADEPPGLYIWFNSPVTWTYTVTNTGNSTLTDLVVTDDPIGTISCPQTTLVVSETMTCTAYGTASLGQYTNAATVTGVPPLGPDVTASDISHYYGISPTIQIQKYTNGEDADEAPGPRIFAGALVTWTYVVTNSGDITLTQVTVVDDQRGMVPCPRTELAPRQVMTCTLTGVAQADRYANLGTASGQPPAGPEVTASDPSHYWGRLAEPAIGLEKSTNGLDADEAPGPLIPVGEPVEWEYTVTNLGNVTVTEIAVMDSELGVISCPSDTLKVDQWMSCTRSGAAVADQYSNVATVTGIAVPPGLPPVEVTDSDPSHYFGSAPGITVEKRTNGEDADEAPGPYILVGDPVAWTYEVRNTGNVSLSGIRVVDDQSVGVSCPATELPVGGSTICTGSDTAVAGPYANTAAAMGTPPVGLQVSADDASHYFGVTLAATFEKRTNDQDADRPPGPLVPVGESVAWTYHLTSESNVELAVAIDDSEGVPITCQETSLPPGGTITCTAEGSAVEGQYANTGTATLTPPGSLAPLVLTDASHYYGSDPRIHLEKLTNSQDADTAPGPFVLVGDDVEWTYLVSNTGNITLTDVSVVDDHGLDLSCSMTILAPGEGMTCTATGTAQPNQYQNTGTARGTPPVGDDVSASDPSHYYGTNPGISLEKHTNGDDADDPPGPAIYAGDLITWTYQVANTGNVTLTNVTVADDQGVVVTCPDDLLRAGTSLTCSATGTAEAGQYANVGTATGEAPVGPLVTASDPSHYRGRTSQPAIDIEKLTNRYDADLTPGPYVPIGEAVTWEYIVANVGNVEVTSIAVTDSELGAVTCPDDRLDEGQWMACTATGVAAPGQYSNRATVVGTAQPGGLESVEVIDSDLSHYFGSNPGIELEKRTNGRDADSPPGVYIVVGDAVLWTYAVTNTGNVTLTDLLVTDDQGVEISCPQTQLGPGQPMICAASGIATKGPYANVGTVTGRAPLEIDITDEDASHYFGIRPGIDLLKYTNGRDVDHPPGPIILEGYPITWTYVVSNTGDVALTNVVVSDDQGVDVTCPQTTLAVSEVVTCTATSTATVGQYANVGAASGTYPGDEAVTASDASYYLGIAVRPAIDIQKRTNGSDADKPPGPYIPAGDAVLWEYRVTNVGNVGVSSITVSDDRLGAITCPRRDLGSTESMECVAGGLAESGQYSNTATVTGTAVTATGTVPIDDTDSSHYFGTQPGVELQKLTNGQDADGAPGPQIGVGRPVTWTYLVTNSGNVPLSAVAVVDDQGEEVACPATTLAVNATMTCTASGTAQAGQYRNLGSVSASFGDAMVEAGDPSHYYGAYTIYLPLVTRRLPSGP